MRTTLDECNEALDWLEESFEFGRELRIRVRRDSGLYYLGLTWYGTEQPRGSFVYPPIGWAMMAWRRAEHGVWESEIFRV
ncbi:MAG: hypothetical protein NTW87_23565 [Planctomycetota bacterium]|nr:hypothetical protein [Planctomycetota bacterium]